MPLPKMIVTSSSFEDAGIIPLRHTMHGENVQPQFTISGAPEDTACYAIIFHDIDVSKNNSTDDVTHWIAWNIPSAEIPEGILPEGSIVGNNIRGEARFMGSGAPFPDRFHHYVYEFYALNAPLELGEGASLSALTEALRGKVVAKAAYIGRYAKAN